MISSSSINDVGVALPCVLFQLQFQDPVDQRKGTYVVDDVVAGASTPSRGAVDPVLVLGPFSDACAFVVKDVKLVLRESAAMQVLPPVGTRKPAATAWTSTAAAP